jgi:DNA polymerase-3 subunit delta
MIYVLFGPDEFSIALAVKKLLAASLPEDTADLNTTRLAAAEATVDALRFACEAAPFLADRRAVVVSGLFARLSARRGRAAARDDGDTAPEREPKLAGEVAAYLPRIPQNTLAVFVEPAAPPKSGPLAKALDAAGAKVKAFPTLAGPPLVRWIKERAKATNVAIADRAAEALATFVGGDLRALANEVDKLAAYAGPGRSIELPDVQLLVSQATEANVFELVDAIGVGNRKRALSALAVLAEHGERPERIMVMIARQVRLLLQVKHALGAGMSLDAIGRDLGLAPFPLRKVADQVRLFQLPQLEAMHRRVLEADVQIKTGGQDPDLAIELLTTELAGEAQPPRRAMFRARA